MRREEFAEDSPGEFVSNLDGDLTFVPSALPGPLRLDLELVSLLSEAERGLGRVTGVSQTLPNPELITRAFVRREAQLSSEIENIVTNYASLAAVKVAGAAAVRHENQDAIAEVLNNEQAITFFLEATKERGRPVTGSLIRDVHAVLLHGARNDAKRPGRYRDRQAFIGSSQDIAEAKLVPAPAHAVEELMEDLCGFIRTTSDLPPLVRHAMIHYQFETIHPFADGNGRTGRALILLLMCVDGLLPQPMLNPSLHMERERPEYYRRLLEVSTRNKWSAWIKFFARSVAAAADDAVARVEAIRDLQASYHERFRQPGRSVALLQLVDELFVEQATTISLVAERLNVKFGTAARHVKTLEDAGVLTEITGRGRDRVYVAPEIIQIIQTPNTA